MPELVANGVAWFFCWLFALAGLHKLRAPAWYGELATAWLPGLPAAKGTVKLAGATELVLALALLVAPLRPAALLAASMLLLLYAALMGLQLARGQRDLRCGCAGPASDVTISPALLLRNLLCALLALVAVAPPVAGQVGFAASGLSLSIALFLVIGYLACEQMIANAQHLAGEH